VASKDIIIIGAGLAGVCAAWTLQTNGHRVTVLDAREGPALETSYANAGALTPSEPEPWNAPGVHWQLLQSLFDPHAAMKLRFAPLPGLISWGMRFLRNSTRTRYETSTRANFVLSRYSLKLTQAARDALGISFDNHRNGTLKLCRDQAGLDATIASAKLLEDLGLRYQVFDAAQTVAHEPSLATIQDQIAGSVLYPDDESGDAHKFTVALADAATEAGVNFEWNSPVTSLIDRGGDIIGVRTEKEELEVDAVILASGQASWRLMAPLGLHLPVRPVKGYSITLDMSGLNARPGVPVVDEALHAIVTPMGDRVRVAGTAEIAGEDKTIRPERIDNLKHMLAAVYPDIAQGLLVGETNEWAGLRPMSADGRPFVGETRAKGLWLSTGHGHLGFTQAMGSAALLSDLIGSKPPQIDPKPYCAARI
jgi:D-amino-acid dehydrogenase